MPRQVIISFLAVLVTMVAGCGGAHHYDGRLVQADSLMPHDPDSALALVQGISPDSLPAPGDRAYRDLLLTQGRYKCYITATSDSDINRALAYYSHHSGEREKLTRAYIYKGAVMEELGYPDSAMTYYKNAEATADPDDSFKQGYINFKIGQLYQCHNVADSLVIVRMRSALKHFTVCQDTNYIIMSMGTLGSYMNDVNKDSARLLLFQAIDLARFTTNLPHRYFYQSKLAGLYFYLGDYQNAKKLAMDIIKNGRDFCYEDMYYYYAARSFIQLGLPDSAWWVASIIPAPQCSQDSMNRYKLFADLSVMTDDSAGYNKYSAQSERIHRRLFDRPSNERLLLTEYEFDASLHQRQLTRMIGYIVLAIVVVIFSLSIVLLVIRKLTQKKERQYKNEMELAQHEIQRMLNKSQQQVSALLKEREKDRVQIKQIKNELAQVNKRNQQLEYKQDNSDKRAAIVIKNRVVALNELYLNTKFETASEGTKRIKPMMEALKDLLNARRIKRMPPSKHFWESLKLSVNAEYPGIEAHLKNNYPNLTERDLQLFMLICAGFPNPIINVCMDYKGEATASKRKTHLLKNKMGLDMKLDQFLESYLKGRVDGVN